MTAFPLSFSLMSLFVVYDGYDAYDGFSFNKFGLDATCSTRANQGFRYLQNLVQIPRLTRLQSDVPERGQQ